MAKLTRKAVLHVAKLANLKLSESEIVRFGSQLTNVLDYFENLLKVEVKNVPPLFSPVKQKNIFRDDKIRPSLSQSEALSNSKSVYCGYFKVKAILDEK